MRAKPLPVTAGLGELRIPGFRGPVAWRIDGDPTSLKLGHNRLKGALTTSAQVAREAFRAGEGLLVMETGDRYRLVMVGHSAGADEVFVEVRV